MAESTSMKATPPNPTPSPGSARLSPVSEALKAAHRTVRSAQPRSGARYKRGSCRDWLGQAYGPVGKRCWPAEMLAESETKSTTSSGGASPTTPDPET
jgi:hypothetical protein